MTRTIVLTILAATIGLTAAQQPQIQNGRVDTRQAGALDRDVSTIAASATEPTWVAWRVPIIDGAHNLCCTYYDSNYGDTAMSRGCLIDPAVPGTPRPQFPPAAAAVQLEGGTGLIVLVRLVDKGVERLRTLSDDCPMDGGGRAIHWLEGVTPADSVKFLRSMALRTDLPTSIGRQLTNSAVSAISYHRDPSATEVLIALAHTDNDTTLRGQALQSLGRRADPRVSQELMAAIEKDKDRNVRTSAVSGLAQQPKDTSVPLLIQIAKTTTDTTVRQRAMSYLGQSKDPRAVAFFQEIIK